MKKCYGCGLVFNGDGGIANHAKYTKNHCTPEMRLWGKVDKSPGPDKCWPWLALRDRYGYGLTVWNKKVGLAHRYIWEVHHGQPIPEGMHLLHSCDNPGCVNPAHLVLGTHQDNMVDKLAKGRCLSKLTRAQVVEIKEAVKAPYKGQLQDLARKYGVSAQQIQGIKSGRRWRHMQ